METYESYDSVIYGVNSLIESDLSRVCIAHQVSRKFQEGNASVTNVISNMMMHLLILESHTHSGLEQSGAGNIRNHRVT